MMNVLGHEFTEMTKHDWYSYGGAEVGTLICHLPDRDLLYDPASGILSEISADGSQRDWKSEVINWYDKDEWFSQFYGCMQDLGCSAYDEKRVERLYEKGYSPAEAAGEEACEGDE